MRSEFLEAGKIVNTHGVRGEVKIQPWADSPEFLTKFRRFIIDRAPVEVSSARVHKGCVIASFEGCSDMEGALRLVDKIVWISSEEARLEPGRNFVRDLIGLRAIDAESGAQIGIVTDVLPRPANNVYVVSGEREILVPAVPDFVREVDLDAGVVKLRLIEGL